jgi:hypothetical protein
MTKVLSLEWSGLTKLTSEIYQAVKLGSDAYGRVDYRSAKDHGTAHYVVHLLPEIVELVNQIFPFMEPTLVIIEQQPGYITPHIDGTVEWGYPYNIVIPIINNDQSTVVYFENTDLVYKEEWKTTGSKYERDLSKLNKIFEFNVKSPFVFFNQQLHTMINRGATQVVVGTWKLHKDLNTDSIVKWSDEQQIVSKEIF